MILAPMLYRPTFYRIYKSKSTEGFQSVPYVVALFSAMLWIFYALIKSNETFLITINAAGCVIETIYIVMYFVYAPKKAKLFTVKIMLLLNIGAFGVVLLCYSRSGQYCRFKTLHHCRILIRHNQTSSDEG